MLRLNVPKVGLPRPRTIQARTRQFWPSSQLVFSEVSDDAERQPDAVSLQPTTTGITTTGEQAGSEDNRHRVGRLNATSPSVKIQISADSKSVSQIREIESGAFLFVENN
jgi:hypothetical protein